MVISIVDQVKANPNYALQVADIEAWEKKHGRIPEGSVVFVRSDWSKAWPDPKLATLKEFPGVGLDALKFLHEQRKILFHWHEPLDTDSTPNLEGEVWLMHHGYAQAEGVANLDQVPETGALVIIGYPRMPRCRNRRSPCTTMPRPACACAEVLKFEPARLRRTGQGC